MKKRTMNTVLEYLAGAAIAALAFLPIALLCCLGGCPGTTTAISCSKNPDGSYQCGLEFHRDGKHEEK